MITKGVHCLLLSLISFCYHLNFENTSVVDKVPAFTKSFQDWTGTREGRNCPQTDINLQNLECNTQTQTWNWS